MESLRHLRKRTTSQSPPLSLSIVELLLCPRGVNASLAAMESLRSGQSIISDPCFSAASLSWSESSESECGTVKQLGLVLALVGCWLTSGS